MTEESNIEREGEQDRETDEISLVVLKKDGDRFLRQQHARAI